MMDQLGVWLLLAGLAVVAAVLFWPRLVLVSRGLHRFRDGERVRVEDALKHLYECEYRGRPATPDDLSGSLQISRDRVARLIEQLEARGLVASRTGSVYLTATGCRHALRVIRKHRLWERYLADRTGVSQSDWHDEADRREHSMTSTEVEALAARMGHPRYDPHGDPIPTLAGDIVPVCGQPLTDVKLDERARIVHVEDEPDSVYVQILNAGLCPGMRIRVEESSARGIVVESDVGKRVLAPVVAANIFVAPLSGEEDFGGPCPYLADLEPGQKGRVVDISPACRAPERRRLMDLGFVPDTVVEAELRSPIGGSVAYRVRDTLIALRKEQADLIQIQLDPPRVT